MKSHFNCKSLDAFFLKKTRLKMLFRSKTAIQNELESIAIQWLEFEFLSRYINILFKIQFQSQFLFITQYQMQTISAMIQCWEVTTILSNLSKAPSISEICNYLRNVAHKVTCRTAIANRGQKFISMWKLFWTLKHKS